MNNPTVRAYLPRHGKLTDFEARVEGKMDYGELTSDREVVGHLTDGQQHLTPMRIHDLAIAPDGTIYAGENDNWERPSALWEVKGPSPSDA